MDITQIVNWVQEHWVGISASVLAFDAFIYAVAPLTPWKWDDSLSTLLRKQVIKYFSKEK